MLGWSDTVSRRKPIKPPANRRSADPWKRAGNAHYLDASVLPRKVMRALKDLPQNNRQFKDVALELKLRSASERRALKQCIQGMLQKGEIEFRGKNMQLARRHIQTGTLIAHPDGFGFIRTGERRESDAFVPPDQMNGLMHGDVVRFHMAMRRGRSYAQVLGIEQQASDAITGQFTVQGKGGFVEPRDRRLPQAVLISRKNAKGAHDGDWVRVKIKRGSQPLRGLIVEKLGDVLNPGKLIDLIVAEKELPHEFPDTVAAEAENMPGRVREKDHNNRTDLTHLPFITIDGEDAKDFDDAICVLPRGDGFEAWVAIADVAEYVQSGTALDAEALARSNSFYFPDRVIPMLPECLSNGICSLKPDVERLAVAVRMRFDAGGRRRAVNIHEAVIRSSARLTYNEASRWLDVGEAEAISSSRIREMLQDARLLFQTMLKLREKRGALDIDLPEVRAIIKNNLVTGIQPQQRNTAHRLIEEMMLAANTAVAGFFEKRKAAQLYRIHEPPKPESIVVLNDFLAPFDMQIAFHTARPVQPADIQRILERFAEKTTAHVLHRIVLRAMQQARYSPDNKGHFGLAYKSYTHFTSPIRRYADLIVHRRLKAMLRGEDPNTAQSTNTLASIGEKTSVQERKQVQAEWDAQAMLAALYHQKDAGKIFEAVISGISERRIFFELHPTLAEGALAVDDLGGNYMLDKKNHRLVAKRGGHAMSLGDKLTVKITAADPVRGRIDVSLAKPD